MNKHTIYCKSCKFASRLVFNKLVMTLMIG